MLTRPFFRVTMFLAVALALSGLVHAQSLLDTFEGSTINPLFWKLNQQYGTIQLSTDIDKTFGGHQSLKFSSTSGGQRYIQASHRFAFPQKGTFSIWFYDVAAGQETQYESIYLTNSQTNDSASVGTQDFDAYCYAASVYDHLTGTHGPNQNCGIYPQVTTTAVNRTVAWHNFSIFVETDHVILAIDGKAVYTYSGNYGYDIVTISQSGPYWRPDTYSYWDDYVGPVWTAQ